MYEDRLLFFLEQPGLYCNLEQVTSTTAPYIQRACQLKWHVLDVDNALREGIFNDSHKIQLLVSCGVVFVLVFGVVPPPPKY